MLNLAAGSAAMLLLSCVALVGVVSCTPKTRDLPVLVESRNDGWLEFTFVMCAGDRAPNVTVVSTVVGHEGSAGQWAKGTDFDVDTVVSVTLDAETVMTGNFADLPPEGTRSSFTTPPTNPAGLSVFSVHSQQTHASLLLDDLSVEPNSAALFSGWPSRAGYEVEAVDAEVARAALGDYCES